MCKSCFPEDFLQRWTDAQKRDLEREGWGGGGGAREGGGTERGVGGGEEKETERDRQPDR